MAEKPDGAPRPNHKVGPDGPLHSDPDSDQSRTAFRSGSGRFQIPVFTSHRRWRSMFGQFRSDGGAVPLGTRDLPLNEELFHPPTQLEEENYFSSGSIFEGDELERARRGQRVELGRSTISRPRLPTEAEWLRSDVGRAAAAERESVGGGGHRVEDRRAGREAREHLVQRGRTDVVEGHGVDRGGTVDVVNNSAVVQTVDVVNNSAVVQSRESTTNSDCLRIHSTQSNHVELTTSTNPGSGRSPVLSGYVEDESQEAEGSASHRTDILRYASDAITDHLMRNVLPGHAGFTQGTEVFSGAAAGAVPRLSADQLDLWIDELMEASLDSEGMRTDRPAEGADVLGSTLSSETAAERPAVTQLFARDSAEMAAAPLGLLPIVRIGPIGSVLPLGLATLLAGFVENERQILSVDHSQASSETSAQALAIAGSLAPQNIVALLDTPLGLPDATLVPPETLGDTVAPSDTRSSTLSSLSLLDLTCFEDLRRSLASPRVPLDQILPTTAETSPPSLSPAEVVLPPFPPARSASAHSLATGSHPATTGGNSAPGETRGDAAPAAMASSDFPRWRNSRERRRSDPFGSRSSSGSEAAAGRTATRGGPERENWYFYDPRLRPGGESGVTQGEVNAGATGGRGSGESAGSGGRGEADEMWAYLQALRQLAAPAVPIAPPSYDDIATTTPLQPPDDTGENSFSRPPPPPYEDPPPGVERREESAITEDSDSLSEPPTYEQVIRERRMEIPCRENLPENLMRENPEIAARRSEGFHPSGEDQWERGGEEDAARFLESLAATSAAAASSAAAAPRLFGGMPAVRWNRNMQVNRWTSLPSWVAS